MNYRISEGQLLNTGHKVIQDFFNEMIMKDVAIEIFNNFAKGVGVGLTNAGCFLPNASDPEENFEGVQFIDFLDSKSPYHDANTPLTVDNETFYYYLSIAGDNFIVLHPQEEQTIKDIMHRVLEKLNIDRVNPQQPNLMNQG